MLEIKTCRKCESTLPLEMFTKHPSKRGGHSNHCRNCENAAKRANRAAKAAGATRNASQSWGIPQDPRTEEQREIAAVQQGWAYSVEPAQLVWKVAA